MSEIKMLMEAIDLVLNEEDDAADKKLHKYFIHLARKINEQIEDSELSEADLEYDQERDITDEISSDMSEIDNEEGIHEFDDEEEEFSDDEMMGDEDALNDLGDDMEQDGDIPDLIQTIEDNLDELKAEFEALTGEMVDGEDEMMGDEGEFETGDEGFDDEGFGGDELDDEGFGDEDEEEYAEESWHLGENEELDEDEELDESDELDEDEDLDESDDEELDEDADDELDESVTLSKVAAPTNSEGQDAGKGGSFTVNTKQNLKPQGGLKAGNTKGVMSTGGETKDHKALNSQGGEKAKEMPNKKDTNVKKLSNADKGKADKKATEVGSAGKSVAGDKNKSLINKKVR